MELAWGCKPHSGWAIAVLVGRSATAPVVLDRRRVQLCPDDLPTTARVHGDLVAFAVLGTTDDQLAARLKELRATVGSPWQADHKDATAAALMALALTA